MGTEQWFRLYNLARIFVNLSWYDISFNISLFIIIRFSYKDISFETASEQKIEVCS